MRKGLLIAAFMIVSALLFGAFKHKKTVSTYASLPVVQAERDPDRVADLLGPSYWKCLESDARSAACLREMPDTMRIKLLAQISCAVAVASGMPYEQYIARENFPDDPEFKKMYLANNNPSVALTGYVVQPEFMRASLVIAGPKNTSGNQDVLGWNISKEDAAFYHGKERGSISQNAAFFPTHVCPDEDTIQHHGTTYYAEVTFVVEDAMGERYPIWEKLYWDAKRDRWQYDYVCRMATHHVTQLPRIAL